MVSVERSVAGIRRELHLASSKTPHGINAAMQQRLIAVNQCEQGRGDLMELPLTGSPLLVGVH